MSGRGIGGWRWLKAPFDTARGMLSGFALWGFIALSVAATGLGFADLRLANTGRDALSLTELAITLSVTLFVVIAMVTALGAALAGRWWLRPLALVFYLFFAVWSVGFGYGFFWKELAGQEFTERQFQRALASVSASMAEAGEALETAEQAALSAAMLAAARAQAEAAEGRTCANRPSSPPGDGPLTRSRFVFADRAQALAADMRQQWIAPVAIRQASLQRRVSVLEARRAPAADVEMEAGERALLERLAGAHTLPSSDRRGLFVSVNAEARALAEAANALRAANAASFAQRLDDMAAEVGPDPQRPGAPDPARANDPGYCWDVVLGEQLAAAANRLRALKDTPPPEFEFLEGPAATRAAVFALAEQAGALFRHSTPHAEAMVFGSREALALFASIAVDLGIFFLTLIRTASARQEGPGRVAAGDAPPQRPRLGQIIGQEGVRRTQRSWLSRMFIRQGRAGQARAAGATGVGESRAAGFSQD